MWIIKFLSGPLAGQTIPLQKNKVTLGRAATCDIKVISNAISKEHTQIEILDDKLLLTDLNSRNGTFLNGVQIRSGRARSGDRCAIHDILFEVQNVPEQWGQQFLYQQQMRGNVAYQQHQHYHHQAPGQYQAEYNEQPQPQAHAQGKDLADRLPLLIEKAQHYIDNVAMPGVYKVAEIFEFKWLLIGFMAVFIVLTTSLSVIPLMRILKSSIEEESQQHALTIATTLARVNRPALMQGMDTAVSVEIAATRPGVKKAMIISNMDGNVIAPASMAGTVPDLPYIHDARKKNKETSHQIDDSTVVAMVPIEFFSPDSGTQAITAWAVVFYDMGSLAVDNGQIISLFITTLCIALLLGFVLFYFLYKVIEHPIRDLNQQLDVALKEGHDTLHVDMQFPALQTLASNVSSALTRAISGGSNNGPQALEHDRNREIANLVQLMAFATIGVHSHDLSIAASNQAFESRTNLSAAQLAAMTVNDISDQALKLSIKDLIARVDQNPAELASNDLEFSGSKFQVVAQGVYGTAKIAYYLIVLLPQDEA